MRRITGWLLMATLLIPSAQGFAQSADRVPRTDEYWYAYASKLPIGSTVVVRTMGGRRYTAALTLVDRDGITLEPRTRVPELPIRLRFSDIDQLQLKENGTNIAKAVGIGIAVGAGTFFGIALLIASAMD